MSESGLPPPLPPFAGGAADAMAWLRSMRARLGAAAAPLGAVVALAVVVALVWASYRSAGAGGPPPEVSLPRVGSADDPSASSSTTADPAAPAGTAADAAVVHVAGAVGRPGLYTLAPSARVADALEAAGGPAGDADVDAINLAARVADGDRVYVPRKGEAPPPAAAGSASAGPGLAAIAVVDLNRATAEQLDALPGVGPSTAAAIVAYRAEHGRFRSVDQLLEVRGIGPSKLAALRSKVRVGA